MWQLLGISSAVLFASSILQLLVRSAEMSGYPITGVLPVLPTVLLRTHFGHAWILRMAAIVALSVTIMAVGDSRHSRLLQGLMLGCAVVVSAMESPSGHASDAGDFSVAEIMDWLHLVAALVWGGGLLVLSLAILPRLVEQGDRAARSMAGIATRFSRIAGVAVGLIVLTASYQEWAYVGSVEGLASSPYGRTIIAKIVLFSLILILGAFNRYIRVPRLQEWAGSATARHGALYRLTAPALVPLARDARGPLAAARFMRIVKLEAFLLVMVLLCTALLRQEIPARHAPHLMHHAALPAAECALLHGSRRTRGFAVGMHALPGRHRDASVGGRNGVTSGRADAYTPESERGGAHAGLCRR
jgi:putative copper resistance protein D